MNLLETLTNIWLSEEEGKIYLSCYELWCSPVSIISKWSQIKRTTLYTILEKMNQKWYLLKSTKENIIYYEAVNISLLYNNFQQKLLQMWENIKEFEKIKNKNTKKSKVTYYEWVENVAKMYQIEADDEPEVVEIFSSNYDRKKWDLDKLRKLRNAIFKTQKKHPFKKMLLNRSLNHSEITRKSLEWKTIPKELLDLPITIKIYKNKVHFISMKSPISWVLIEDEEIAKTISNIFNYIYVNK